MSENREHLRFYEQPLFINILLLVFNATLFSLKFIFSILTNSLALQADAFDNLTDIVMNITAFIGIFFAKKKPNEKFPYGYYKLENIVSLLFSLIIFISAFNIIIQSFTDIINFIHGTPRIVTFTPEVFIFLVLSLASSVVLSLYLKFVGTKTGSPIIKSEAKEKLFDNLLSLSVLIGFIGFIYNLFILDSIIGFIIAIFIIKGGYDIFVSSIKTLLDAVIDFDNRTELYTLIEDNPKVKKIEKMEIRSYGRYIFLELEISLSKNFPLSKIDILKNKLENEIKEKFPLIFKIITVIKSEEKPILTIAVPVKDNNSLNSIIAEHFGESPYFGLLEFQEGNFLKYEIVANKFVNEEKRKGLLVSDWLLSKKADKIYIKMALKKGPTLIFENNFVEMEVTDLENLNEIIEKEKINSNSY